MKPSDDYGHASLPPRWVTPPHLKLAWLVNRQNSKGLMSVVSLFALLFSLTTWSADLPRLNIDHSRVIATGVSSGGIMAVQLGVAHSETFRGIAVFAGGIYGCADPNITLSKNCLQSPNDPRSNLMSYLTYKYSLNLIDSPKNIARQKVYLFSGTSDKIVLSATMYSLAAFYRLLGSGPNLKFDVIRAGHGQPTSHKANKCKSNKSPWLINCDINGAEAALSHILGSARPSGSADQTHLLAFDQSKYAESEAGMAKEGLVYVPKRCQDGSPCGLIVALHGCGQSPVSIGPEYAKKAGFNEAAESNGFVVLYPAVQPGYIRNRPGCWDWWGYTGERMTDKQGPQISAISNMVSHIMGR